MIAKISDPRGKRVGGLIWYLFGPGRREEHTDPHIVAGWRHPAELEPPLRPNGCRDFRQLTGLLQQPHAVLGPRGFDRPVWHCAVRAAPEDRMLSDDEWAQIAGDIMHRTGLSAVGQEDTPVGNSLRRTARLLAAAGAAGNGQTLALVTLITRLAALAEAVAELRHAQRHAAQAASARKAADHLHAAAGDYRAHQQARQRQRTAAEQARLDFPVPIRLPSRQASAPGVDQPARPGPRPARRVRGPTW